MQQLISKKVEEIKVGNRVDLESCPFLNKHAAAKSEFGLVAHVERETDNCIVIDYDGIDQVGYPVGTVLQVRAPKDVPDPVVRVHPLGKPDEWEEWRISQNLTDRWGEINTHNANKKPLDLLEDDSELFERLTGQMWEEMTFIVRKDGKFGILFEQEYCSQESEDHAKNGDPEWYATLKPHAKVVKALLDGMKNLAEKFPGVEFCVPDESQIIDDRPAAWAFVPDGLLTDEQREELGHAMLDL